ncbi:SflA family class IV lanthipeptide [Sphaerisporangium fuscum]|uniref:SflA family class IV lanthipeptide n=1 Tax=Sphaerisporangium fuscum TaxID=2835868 RepID=UPI001BDD18CA|nr:SflA family class IV lanthipeptide [Sphaerisporangium fuscum]
MSALLLEPRDAGVLDIEDLAVDFEGELAALLHGPQACANTCKRTVCSSFPCCPSIV